MANFQEEGIRSGSSSELLISNKPTFYRPRYVPFVNSKSDPIRRASTLSSIPESQEETDDYDEATSENESQDPEIVGNMPKNRYINQEQDDGSNDKGESSRNTRHPLFDTQLRTTKWQEDYFKANSQKIHLPEHERGLSYWGRLFRQNADQARRRNETRLQ
ncbi:hypothetical protein BROUX41_005605 [Berkeleyomyces rouxiae]